jgi:hypothetical protein
VPFRAQKRDHDPQKFLAEKNRERAEADFGEVFVKASAAGGEYLQFYVPGRQIPAPDEKGRQSAVKGNQETVAGDMKRKSALQTGPLSQLF